MSDANAILLTHIRTMGRYNQWANIRLYAACGALSPEDFSRPRPSFFGSIMATLNHILVGDSIWFGRFTGNLPPGVTQLNQILHPDYAALKSAREAKDAEIIAFCDSMTTDRLNGMFSYTNSRGQSFTDPLFPPLMHFFNHQTHHRGQVHVLLSHAGINPPELDMIFYMRETA